MEIRWRSRSWFPSTNYRVLLLVFIVNPFLLWFINQIVIAFNVYKLWNYSSESILTVAGCLGDGLGTVRCVVHPACKGRHATRGRRRNPILPHARVAQAEELQGMSSVDDK